VVVARVGSLTATDDVWRPYQLIDPNGAPVAAVTLYLRELQACGRPVTTQRSYGMDLLRWFRFLWTIGVPWQQATRAEARDFCLWIQTIDKPRREPDGSVVTRRPTVGGGGERAGVNPVTGKRVGGRTYAATTVAHCETVLRSFYDFHLNTGDGPMVNPFPLARDRRGQRANAHHNPLEPFRAERSGLYRPKVTARVPRQIPDAWFDELFATLPSYRDQALVACWVSSGVRASELLGVTCGDVDPGRQLITVVRKGSRAMQQVPVSPDAFVWLRLYQAQMQGLVLTGRDDPLWWTLRRPFRQLAYHAAYRMFTRVNAALGANWTLHDLRHTAAYRMARDPNMPLTDVQWVLGHVHLTTTQLYLSPLPEDVIANVVAFHQRRAVAATDPPIKAGGDSAYRSESLAVLFGEQTA
jgi:site-specific recombinase XerC